MPATSIFDTLYRIRIRANYTDIDSFIYNDADTFDFATLQIVLCNIVFDTSLVFEMIIAKSIGKKQYEAMVMDFQNTSAGKQAKRTVSARWKVAQTFL